MPAECSSPRDPLLEGRFTLPAAGPFDVGSLALPEATLVMALYVKRRGRMTMAGRLSPQQSGSGQAPEGQGRDNKIRLWSIIAGVCTGLILPVLVSLITVSFSSYPRITAASAHEFLADYYFGMPDSNLRHAIYNDDLSQNFKQFPGHSWPEVNKFFGEQQRITVDAVIPVSGDPAEFHTRLTYYSRQGSKYSEYVNFWLVCSDYWARFPIGPSCPTTDLKIDNTERSSSTP